MVLVPRGRARPLRSGWSQVPPGRRALQGPGRGRLHVSQAGFYKTDLLTMIHIT